MTNQRFGLRLRFRLGKWPSYYYIHIVSPARAKNASQMLSWNRKMPIYDMMMSDIYWIFHGFIKCHLLKKRNFILWMCHHQTELRLQCNLSKLLNSRAGTADTGIDYFRKLAWLPKAPLCKVWNLTIKKTLLRRIISKKAMNPMNRQSFCVVEFHLQVKTLHTPWPSRIKVFGE